MLNDSCLIPFLLKELGNVSFTNMCERAEYYLSIVNVIREICHPLSARMLYAASPDEASVFQCLTHLEEQAQCYTKVMIQQRKSGQPSTGRFRVASSSGRSNADNEERLGIELADSIVVCVLALKELRISDPYEAEDPPQLTQSTTQRTDREQEYIQQLKPFQIDFNNDIHATHLFASEAASEASIPKDRLVRLGREIAGLSSLLPLNSSSSVLVRIDEEKQTLWTAMIIGPEDTPYSGGCFLFDIYFPPSYPNASPKVLLTTTGGGRVRFNPNLYKNGKVCLSLLGTWSGAAGEMWDSSASSIYQVLVSIQSLILVSEPYFNEPGYEETMHTPNGKNKSKQYNQDIREHTIHRAMIDYLRKAPPAFKSAITTHFKLVNGFECIDVSLYRLRKEYIMETCLKWIEEGEAVHNTSHVNRLKSLVHELKTLLEALP